MNAIWFDDTGFSDDPERASGTPEELVRGPLPKERPRRVYLAWESFPAEHLCQLWHPSFADAGDAVPADTGLRLTKKEKFERYIQHVVAHEIGHTLGLRHNFKGSLLPPSSSVMDYLSTADSIATHTPQAYDVDAVRYLYGLSTTLPAQPFCNDSGTRTDADCVTFDSKAKPREEFWTPTYTRLADRVVNDGWGVALLNYYVDYYMNGLLGYARATADAALARTVLDAALGKGKAPALATLTPAQAANADLLATRVLKRLFLDAPAARGAIRNDPALAAFVADARAQAGQILTNADKIRSFESRRAMVDLLKKMQSNDAYNLLVTSKASIVALRPSLTGGEAALTDELLSRIDAAINPYFN
jgi:hypothetical protein